MKSLTTFFASTLVATACLVLVTPASLAAEQETMATVSVMGYGYKVKMEINAADIGIQGGKSENRRLFGKNDPMAKQATPAIRAKNFVLNPDDNQYRIAYEKIDPKSTDALEITIAAEGYPAPLLRLHAKSKPAGSLTGTFKLEKSAPANFKTQELVE